ncbi:kinase-like protein [Calocera cornea HHB12733]|uniref:Kinase-like protein n=1 Tax=Calocera cornea HHB12733 TaxID=1353952 RepID=A0A165E1F1_9BASI|nr:kinase-like protein [Calocera cornea HHB12733]
MPLRVALKNSRFIAPPNSEPVRLYAGYERHSIAREVSVSLRVQHPNILPFLGSMYLAVPNGVCLVSPWMDNGNALDYIVRTHCSLPTVLGLLRGIAVGLDFLHMHTPPIVHGDIKGSNVLIDDEGQPRLADFGFARYVDLDVIQSTPSAGYGTIAFQAPERLDPARFGLSTMQTWIPAMDVFSFGMMTWEVRVLYVSLQMCPLKRSSCSLDDRHCIASSPSCGAVSSWTACDPKFQRFGLRQRKWTRSSPV